MGEANRNHLAYFEALGATIRPPEAASFSAWLPRSIVLVDGPQAGQLWNADGGPYLPDIADCLGEDDPCNRVTIRKSQQSGASILALAWLIFIADRERANTLYGVPGLDMLRDINGQKLQPLIDAFQRRAGRAVFVPQTSRSGSGSTTYEKRFVGGGFAMLANANSVMDLSGKTVKKLIKDELSKWQDIPGFGDPDTLAEGRLTAFQRTEDYKVLEISTPEVDMGDDTLKTPGHCRIDASFRRSDQRYWNVACPNCRRLMVFDDERLRIDRESPQHTRYECRCGYLISEPERVLAVRGAKAQGGGWIASVEGEGRHPGFHIDAYISLMMSFKAIAQARLKAELGSEKGRKDYANLVLGRPYKFRGDAPDHVRLMERREDGLRQGHVPARGLLLVAAADVQMRGVYVEVTAYAPDGQSWLVDAAYLDGETEAPDAQVFTDLLAFTVDRTFPDAFGGRRRIDALGIDSGYRSHVVYSFVRTNQRVHTGSGLDIILALDGRDGWNLPAIGVPKLVDIDLEGRRTKQGCKLWPVGTWSLKSSLYTDLHKNGIRSGALEDPPGYCHFGLWVGETYFKQLTAEHLADIVVRGQVTGRKWDKSGDNHFLDTRIYTRALAEYLGMSSMTADDWAALARHRGIPEELTARDLFTPAPKLATAGVREAIEAAGGKADEPSEPPPPPEPEAPSAPGWFDRDTSNWF